MRFCIINMGLFVPEMANGRLFRTDTKEILLLSVRISAYAKMMQKCICKTLIIIIIVHTSYTTQQCY